MNQPVAGRPKAPAGRVALEDLLLAMKHRYLDFGFQQSVGRARGSWTKRRNKPQQQVHEREERERNLQE